MSFLLGTSFGTANTVGVVLITIARAGGVSIPMTAGAILCGIYFGDRSSPMSSSLLLLSTLSETRLYDNVRMGLASSAIPFALASGGYLLCSYVSPLSAASGQMAEQLAGVFRLHPLVLLPTAVVFLLCVARKPVKWAMAGQHGAGLYSGGEPSRGCRLWSWRGRWCWVFPCLREIRSTPLSMAGGLAQYGQELRHCGLQLRHCRAGGGAAADGPAVRPGKTGRSAGYLPENPGRRGGYRRHRLQPDHCHRADPHPAQRGL